MTNPAPQIDLDALERLAQHAKEWADAGCPVDDERDTYPFDLFFALVTPTKVLELIRMARAAAPDIHSCSHLCMRPLCVAQRRAVELEGDALRYRHLVATCNIDYAPEEPWQLVIWEPNTGEDWKAKLDEAIDSAIAAQGGAEK